MSSKYSSFTNVKFDSIPTTIYNYMTDPNIIGSSEIIITKTLNSDTDTTTDIINTENNTKIITFDTHVYTENNEFYQLITGIILGVDTQLPELLYFTSDSNKELVTISLGSVNPNSISINITGVNFNLGIFPINYPSGVEFESTFYEQQILSLETIGGNDALRIADPGGLFLQITNLENLQVITPFEEPSSIVSFKITIGGDTWYFAFEGFISQVSVFNSVFQIDFIDPIQLIKNPGVDNDTFTLTDFFNDLGSEPYTTIDNLVLEELAFGTPDNPGFHNVVNLYTIL